MLSNKHFEPAANKFAMDLLPPGAINKGAMYEDNREGWLPSCLGARNGIGHDLSYRGARGNWPPGMD